VTQTIRRLGHDATLAADVMMLTAIPNRARPVLRFNTLMTACEAHLQHLADRHYAETTCAVRRVHLRLFCTWAAARGVTEVETLTRTLLEAYRHHLIEYRKPDGAPLSLASQHTRLTHLRVWCAWLAREQYLADNPAVGLELPRVAYRLPAVCSVAEVEQVLLQPDRGDPAGVRDRAILETFYATGMRRTELVRLALPDLDWGRRLVLIRQGKGRRDRLVPIGPRALGWVARYLAEVRPRSVRAPDGGTVFLTARGRPFHPNHLSALVRGYVAAAQLGKRGACHLFRHTMATLMLEGGADIRFIQEMLGHVDLTSTQRYTHVSVQQLQAVHSATHPAARVPVPHQRRRPPCPWRRRRPSRRR
jgi:integrase/recombinase XerD